MRYLLSRLRVFRFHLGPYWHDTLTSWGLLALILLALPVLFLMLMPESLVGIWVKVIPPLLYGLLFCFWLWVVVPPYIQKRRRKAVVRAMAEAGGWYELRGRQKIRPDLTLIYGGDAGFDMWTLQAERQDWCVRCGDTQIAAYLPITLVTEGIHLLGYGDAENLLLIDLSYVFVPTVETRFPRLLIRGESKADKVKSKVGLEDIDFESHEFSEAFYVQSEDRRFAYDIITPQFMELLMMNKDYTLIFDHNGLIVLRGTRLWTQAEFQPAMELALAAARIVPKYVWDRYSVSMRRGTHG